MGAAPGGLGGDGGGGDVGPVAGFGAGVPEAGAVAAELGLGGVEEGALVDVGGVGVDAEEFPVGGAALAVEGDGVVLPFFESDADALAGGALLDFKGELGAEVLDGVFLADDAHEDADAFGVAGGGFDGLDVFEDAVEGSGENRGQSCGGCGGDEVGELEGGGAGAVAEGFELAGDAGAEFADFGEPDAEGVAEVAGVVDAGGDVSGEEADAGSEFGEAVGVVEVPLGLSVEEAWVVGLAFHGALMAFGLGVLFEWGLR